MKLEYVPLLQVQRRLQGLPRDYARFQEYLWTMLNETRTGVELPPLGIMNPMGREHVTALLDDLLALDADGIAARVTVEAAAQLVDEPGEFQVTVVVADDLKGGWTNRYDWEYTLRFGPGPASLAGPELPKWLKHWWLTAVLWSSEPASERAVREAVLTAAFRVSYLHRHGSPRTLHDMLAQEGQVMARAGCARPVLDDDDIAYTREVLIPFLDATDKRTAIECLFGDEPGRTLGFTPRGLSPWAGLALALYDARAGDRGTMVGGDTGSSREEEHHASR
jgi:hypothetical protein